MKKLFLFVCMTFMCSLTYATVDCTAWELISASENSLELYLPTSPNCNIPTDYDFNIRYRENGTDEYQPLGNHSITSDYVDGKWVRVLHLPNLTPCTGYDFCAEVFCGGNLEGDCCTDIMLPYETTGCENEDCDNIQLVYEGENILGFSLQGSCEQEPGRIFFQSEYKESGGTWIPYHNAISTTNDPSPAILDLAPCTKYEVRFRIKCNDVYGDWCELEGMTQCPPCQGPPVQCRRRNFTQGIPWTVETDCRYTACIGDNIRIQMRGRGGNGPFTYEWSGGIPTSNPSVIRPVPNVSNDYTVTVTDANGCSSVETFSVTFENCCELDDRDCATILTPTGPLSPRYSNNSDPIAVNIYPNPTDDFVYMEIGSLEETTAQITLTNSTGKTIRTYNEKLNVGTTQIQINELDTLPTGVYFYQIQVGDYINYGKLLIQ